MLIISVFLAIFLRVSPLPAVSPHPVISFDRFIPPNILLGRVGKRRLISVAPFMIHFLREYCRSQVHAWCQHFQLFANRAAGPSKTSSEQWLTWERLTRSRELTKALMTACESCLSRWQVLCHSALRYCWVNLWAYIFDFRSMRGLVLLLNTNFACRKWSMRVYVGHWEVA